MPNLGFHRWCGGEVVTRVRRHFRAGFDRFAEPDEEVVLCLYCGETDLPEDEIADTYEEAMGDGDDA